MQKFRSRTRAKFAAGANKRVCGEYPTSIHKLLEKIEKYKDWVSEVKLLLDQYQENLQFEQVEIKEKEGENGFRVIKVNGVSIENEETFRKLQKAKNKACELAYGELKEKYPSKK